MNAFKPISPNHPRFQEAEFVLLLGWALLFPAKIGYAYYLGFTCLLALFTLAKIATLKNLVVDRYVLFLAAFNAVFIAAAFFSPFPLQSLLFTADLLLLSLWSVFFFLEKRDVGRYLHLAAWVISLASLAVLAAFALQGGRLPVTVVFRNPILQGIASAWAALIFLQRLQEKWRRGDAVLLALNAAAVVVSSSKAAFLGLAFFAAIMAFRRRRRWRIGLGAALLLLALLPNPMRRTFVHSLRHDPYVFDRVQIWGMSARMFRAHPWAGVGPDLFAAAAPRFNFAQDKGPSRYGKVPESPHSDYWRVIVETGLAGLLLVFLFLLTAIPRLLRTQRDDTGKWPLAFLLAQMLLFNFVFQPFFLLLFLFLLRDFYAAGRTFAAPPRPLRAAAAALLAFVLVTLYLLPFLADRRLEQASAERDPLRRFALLRQAERLSPLDERAPLAKAALLRAFARRRSDLAAWTGALDAARRAQRLNRASVPALILEAELFQDTLAYEPPVPAQAGEILGPLRRAERLTPFDPFLKMRQAVVLRRFNRLKQAQEQATAALKLEPDYAAAVAFLHELAGGAADDPLLLRRLEEIAAKARSLKAGRGSYLHNLHRLPPRPGAEG